MQTRRCRAAVKVGDGPPSIQIKYSRMRGKANDEETAVRAFAAATAGVRADEVGPRRRCHQRIGELAPVVIYGSRVDDTAESMASPVRVFEAPAIAAPGARSLPELLGQGGRPADRTLNANPLQSQVAMRGYGENSFGRVKIVIDGEEINPSTWTRRISCAFRSRASNASR